MNYMIWFLNVKPVLLPVTNKLVYDGTVICLYVYIQTEISLSIMWFLLVFKGFFCQVHDRYWLEILYSFIFYQFFKKISVTLPQKQVWKCFFLIYLLKEFVKLILCNSLMFVRTNIVKSSGSFFVWKLRTINSVSLIDNSYPNFLFHLVLVLISWILKDICPSHILCQIYWHKHIHNVLLFSI